MNKQNKALLLELYKADQCAKYPSVPSHLMGVKKYTDSTTNGLTKCVIDFLNLSGHQAERINTMGRVLDNRKSFVDVVGRTRVIGSTKYIKGTGTVGSADISATIRGKAVRIEIKYGRDRQSQAQKQYQEQIERAGGTYIIVRDFDSFIEWYNSYLESL